MIIYLQFHFIWGNKYMHLQINHISSNYVTYVETLYFFLSVDQLMEDRRQASPCKRKQLIINKNFRHLAKLRKDAETLDINFLTNQPWLQRLVTNSSIKNINTPNTRISTFYRVRITLYLQFLSFNEIHKSIRCYRFWSRRRRPGYCCTMDPEAF